MDNSPLPIYEIIVIQGSDETLHQYFRSDSVLKIEIPSGMAIRDLSKGMARLEYVVPYESGKKEME